ncbi:polyprenyl synthetase family protein [Streptomyces sp. NPDC048577]|uniref:polyprenyl synthetase family protein n=1 Tax=Streptomyces sp. NPDC048577 TaxID=3157209 RepID=UPI00342F75EB
MACACRLGALYAGADAERVAACARFGEDLGMAFQLVDDVRGFWGDPSLTGKPVGSDLTARKKSFPVAAALSTGTPSAERLSEVYASATPVRPAGPRRDHAAGGAAGGRERRWRRPRRTRRAHGPSWKGWAAPARCLRRVPPPSETSWD